MKDESVEIGSHAELMAADGTYAGLMQQQMNDDDDDRIPDFEDVPAHRFAADDLPELPRISTGHHHGPSSRSSANHVEVNIRSLEVWMRLLGLVRPVRWQFLGTVALGMLNHGSVIILGALTALLVGAVFREEPLTTLVILVCVY